MLLDRSRAIVIVARVESCRTSQPNISCWLKNVNLSLLAKRRSQKRPQAYMVDLASRIDFLKSYLAQNLAVPLWNRTLMSFTKATAQINPLISANTSKASRHPQWSNESCTRGINTVLANPPHSVIAVMPARALFVPTRRAITANAGLVQRRCL